MAWVITARDSHDGPSLRQDKALMDAHGAYEQSIRDGILCAGSLLVLDVGTREGVLALLVADPATRAGLRTNITVTSWNEAIFAGKVCG